MTCKMFGQQKSTRFDTDVNQDAAQPIGFDTVM